jgi:hypothetical protein
MQPKIMERASDALAVTNRNPFPNPLPPRFAKKIVRDYCGCSYSDQSKHLHPVSQGRSISLIGNDTPPTAQPTPAQTKKPKPSSHLVKFARLVTVVTRRFFCSWK